MSESFTYDKLSRIQSVTEPAVGGGQGWTRTFAYDRWGNQWVDAANSSGVGLDAVTPNTSSWITPKNRLGLSAGNFDRSGNQTKVAGYSAVYDAENRLTTLGTALAYSYDGDGRRVKKLVAGGAGTYYVYDAFGQLAAEYTTGAAPAGGCASCYLLPDHLGSTRALWDAGGVRARYDYMPFGELVPSDRNSRTAVACGTGVTSCYAGDSSLTTKFTGKERDQETVNSAMSTGLDYFGARYFSAAQGRFTSPDKPFADQHAENPQTWNLYTYSRNNPLRYVDENGQASVEYQRRLAVRLAWEKERQLVAQGKSTRNWTADQAQELWTTGKVRGIQGHHGNSVAANPGMAGDPDYIKFVEQGEEHLAEHGGNFRNPTTGPKIARGIGALAILQVLVSALADYQQTSITGVTESMSPFSFGQTYILDPTQAAKTLDDAYIQVSGENAGTYHVQNGQYIRTGCNDKPEKCAIDPSKLQGAQFEIVKPMM